MPDIYQYLDYRAFLGDYFTEQKARLPQFSHEYFARKAHIKSKGFVLHVIKGERNLTRTVLLNIARAIGLSCGRTAYFEDLVAFNQAKTQSDREFYLARITEKRKVVNARQLDDRHYELYGEWYHTVLREAIALTGGNADHVKLAKLLVPSITARQVKESLQLQRDIGVIEKDDKKNYRQTEPFVAIGGPVRTTAVVKYQKDMLSQAQSAWDRFSGEEMSMHTVTLCVSEKMLDTIREEVRNFKERLFKLAATENVPPERVYHINVNVFPVTKSVKEKKS